MNPGFVEMKPIVVITILFSIATVAVGLVWNSDQVFSAGKVCQQYPVGTRIEEVSALPDNFFVSRQGPFSIGGDTSRQKIIFCDTLTLCDNSCSLEIENQVVQSADYAAL